MLNALKEIGHPSTSREISGKLAIANADYGRQMVRQRMEQLIKDGKVKAEKPKEAKAKQLYALP